MSRYLVQKPLPKERAKRFTGLDNLTAQTPLIEVIRKQPYHIRIWVAYDYNREHGTYVAVFFSGMIKTVTVYPAGNKTEKVVRPADR